MNQKPQIPPGVNMIGKFLFTDNKNQRCSEQQ